MCGIVGIMANAVQFPRLLLLVSIVDSGLGGFLALPLLAMGGVGLLGGWVLSRVHSPDISEHRADIPLQNPYALTPALKFGAFFVVIFFLTKASQLWIGEAGIFLASAIAGLGDASVISLSVADMVGSGAMGIPAAATAILIAVTMNAVAKWTLSLLNGTRELAYWLGGGFLVMLSVGVTLTMLLHTR
jgi:uncharacterized membrane protein (DUF4010 family)